MGRAAGRSAVGPRRRFLALGSKKELIGPTRPKLLDWHCPFAAQAVFPSGHRYCLNVYSGCAHDCKYCYAVSYSPPKAFQVQVSLAFWCDEVRRATIRRPPTSRTGTGVRALREAGIPVVLRGGGWARLNSLQPLPDPL